MKIAIVVHTASGHTGAFAQSICDALRSRGHDVDLLPLRVSGSVSVGFSFTGNNFTIKSPPELDEYDAVLVGGPVWAFKPSPVIMSYLIEDVKSLKGKKALPFVTMGSPFKWTGGERAIWKMSDELAALGADVLDGEMLHYFVKANAEKMAAAVERICGHF